MPEVDTLDQYADRRRHLRRPVNQSAELTLRTGEDVYDCTVIDESEGGLQVELGEQIDLPDEVVIRFSHQASQLVRRCWSLGTKVGYRFIDPAPTPRPTVKDVPPPARHEAGAEPAAIGDFACITPAALGMLRREMDLLYSAAPRIGLPRRGEPRLSLDTGLRTNGETQRNLGLPGQAGAREALPETLSFFSPHWRLDRQ